MAEDPKVHPEAGQAPFRGEPWTWREPSHGEHFRTCSFCGSIHPGDLAAEAGWRPEWADRKYGWPHKFYVDIPNRVPERLFAIGGTSRFHEADRGRYVPFEELTDEQAAIAARDGWTSSSWGPGSGIHFGTRPVHHAKFYTIHLADSALDEAVRTTIAARSGLEFTFLEGRVAWRPFVHTTTS
mgnify:CR=1 FL=1